MVFCLNGNQSVRRAKGEIDERHVEKTFVGAYLLIARLGEFTRSIGGRRTTIVSAVAIGLWRFQTISNERGQVGEF